MTEHDKFGKTKIMYHSLEKCDFQFEHCWHILKDQPKWISRATKDGPKQRTTPINLETKNVIENEVTELDRPIGRKAEKRKRKAQGMHVEEITQIRKMKYTLLEESRVQEKEFYRLKAEKMEYDKEKGEKMLRLEAEKIEHAKKESDQRIMMLDLSAMPEMQRQYFEDLQREIMRRHKSCLR